jgi:hypothetical protein
MSVQSFKSMLGKIMVSVIGKNHGDTMVFTDVDDNKYTFYHSQGCCESVRIEDIVGDLSDLVGSPMVEASESSSRNQPVPGRERQPESHTWTFYRFSTNKGTVTVRWLGTSNGYYSERVSFSEEKASAREEVEPEDDEEEDWDDDWSGANVSVVGGDFDGARGKVT